MQGQKKIRPRSKTTQSRSKTTLSRSLVVITGQKTFCPGQKLFCLIILFFLCILSRHKQKICLNFDCFNPLFTLCTGVDQGDSKGAKISNGGNYYLPPKILVTQVKSISGIQKFSKDIDIQISLFAFKVLVHNAPV